MLYFYICEIALITPVFLVSTKESSIVLSKHEVELISDFSLGYVKLSNFLSCCIISGNLLILDIFS